MDLDQLKDFLDFKAEQYENPDFLSSDPIQIPHRFSAKQDIEIVGFLVATIAWGNRISIIKSSEKLLDILEHQPYNFIKEYTPGSVLKSAFVHRTFNCIDLDFFFQSLQNCYKKHNSLEETFLHGKNIKDQIAAFRSNFLSIPHPDRTRKHISDPLRNASCKRLNMYLRWMVRPAKKGVDFGLWNKIKTNDLYIPLDVHTGNQARKLGILNRNQNDWAALEELMNVLRSLDPTDPVKYDFALFGIGAFEGF